MTDGGIIQIITVTTMGVLCVTVTNHLGRALRRWLELRHQQPSIDSPHETSHETSQVLAALDDLRDRMGQLERTIEASAVELERIGEADRYIAKLLVERVPAAVPAPRSERAERVITPH